MIKHIVLWRIAENKEETAKLMKEKLEELKDKIDLIVDLQVGINYNESEAASDIALVSTFKSREDLQAYIVHPEHVKVGAEYVRPNVSERRVIDYEF